MLRQILKMRALHQVRTFFSKLQQQMLKIHRVIGASKLLLDPGSHRTYVTEKLANRLELKLLEKEIISVVTFGSTKPKQIESHVVSIELPLKDGTSFNLLANVIPEITGFIQRSPLQIGKTAFLWKDLPLADSIPTEKEISTVELPIGSD